MSNSNVILNRKANNFIEDWETFSIDKTFKQFTEKYLSLNYNKWLSSFLLNDSILSIIEKYKFSNEIGIIRSECLLACLNGDDPSFIIR